VVGERTFRVIASEQKLITIDDGSALILTRRELLTTRMEIDSEEGVTPSEAYGPKRRG